MENFYIGKKEVLFKDENIFYDSESFIQDGILNFDGFQVVLNFEPIYFKNLTYDFFLIDKSQNLFRINKFRKKIENFGEIEDKIETVGCVNIIVIRTVKETFVFNTYFDLVASKLNTDIDGNETSKCIVFAEDLIGLILATKIIVLDFNLSLISKIDLEMESAVFLPDYNVFACLIKDEIRFIEPNGLERWEAINIKYKEGLLNMIDTKIRPNEAIVESEEDLLNMADTNELKRNLNEPNPKTIINETNSKLPTMFNESNLEANMNENKCYNIYNQRTKKLPTISGELNLEANMNENNHSYNICNQKTKNYDILKNPKNGLYLMSCGILLLNLNNQIFGFFQKNFFWYTKFYIENCKIFNIFKNQIIALNSKNKSASKDSQYIIKDNQNIIKDNQDVIKDSQNIIKFSVFRNLSVIEDKSFVVDGNTIHYSDLGRSLIPPPFYFKKITVSTPVINIHYKDSHLFVLQKDSILIYRIGTNIEYLKVIEGSFEDVFDFSLVDGCLVYERGEHIEKILFDLRELQLYVDNKCSINIDKGDNDLNKYYINNRCNENININDKEGYKTDNFIDNKKINNFIDYKNINNFIDNKDYNNIDKNDNNFIYNKIDNFIDNKDYNNIDYKEHNNIDKNANYYIDNKNDNINKEYKTDNNIDNKTDNNIDNKTDNFIDNMNINNFINSKNINNFINSKNIEINKEYKNIEINKEYKTDNNIDKTDNSIDKKDRFFIEEEIKYINNLNRKILKIYSFDHLSILFYDGSFYYAGRFYNFNLDSISLYFDMKKSGKFIYFLNFGKIQVLNLISGCIKFMEEKYINSFILHKGYIVYVLKHGIYICEENGEEPEYLTEQIDNGDILQEESNNFKQETVKDKYCVNIEHTNIKDLDISAFNSERGDINKTPITINDEETASINETSANIKETPTIIKETLTSINKTPASINYKETSANIKETPTSISETSSSISETPVSINYKETAANINDGETSANINISETPSGINGKEDQKTTKLSSKLKAVNVNNNIKLNSITKTPIFCCYSDENTDILSIKTNKIILHTRFGTLETITNRIMTIEIIKDLKKLENFKEAADLCDIHHIEYTIFEDSNINSLISQFKDTQTLSLFNSLKIDSADYCIEPESIKILRNSFKTDNFIYSFKNSFNFIKSDSINNLLDLDSFIADHSEISNIKILDYIKNCSFYEDSIKSEIFMNKDESRNIDSGRRHQDYLKESKNYNSLNLFLSCLTVKDNLSTIINVFIFIRRIDLCFYIKSSISSIVKILLVRNSPESICKEAMKTLNLNLMLSVHKACRRDTSAFLSFYRSAENKGFSVYDYLEMRENALIYLLISAKDVFNKKTGDAPVIETTNKISEYVKKYNLYDSLIFYSFFNIFNINFYNFISKFKNPRESFYLLLNQRFNRRTEINEEAFNYALENLLYKDFLDVLNCYNNISDDDNIISGDDNNISGDDNNISGDDNNISGDDNNISGDNNNICSNIVSDINGIVNNAGSISSDNNSIVNNAGSIGNGNCGISNSIVNNTNINNIKSNNTNINNIRSNNININNIKSNNDNPINNNDLKDSYVSKDENYYLFGTALINNESAESNIEIINNYIESDNKIEQYCLKFISKLKDNGMFTQSAEIFLYLKDFDNAVKYFILGKDFKNAFLYLTRTIYYDDYLPLLIDKALEGFKSDLVDLEDILSDFNRYYDRIKLVRNRLEENMVNNASGCTSFTYTSQKSVRKALTKDRPGGVFENEYILNKIRDITLELNKVIGKINDKTSIFKYYINVEDNLIRKVSEIRITEGTRPETDKIIDQKILESRISNSVSFLNLIDKSYKNIDYKEKIEELWNYKRIDCDIEVPIVEKPEILLFN